MANYRCPVCHEIFQGEQEKCPHCGVPFKKKQESSPAASTQPKESECCCKSEEEKELFRTFASNIPLLILGIIFGVIGLVLMVVGFAKENYGIAFPGVGLLIVCLIFVFIYFFTRIRIVVTNMRVKLSRRRGFYKVTLPLKHISTLSKSYKTLHIGTSSSKRFLFHVSRCDECYDVIANLIKK